MKKLSYGFILRFPHGVAWYSVFYTTLYHAMP